MIIRPEDEVLSAEFTHAFYKGLCACIDLIIWKEKVTTYYNESVKRNADDIQSHSAGELIKDGIVKEIINEFLEAHTTEHVEAFFKVSCGSDFMQNSVPEFGVEVSKLTTYFEFFESFIRAIVYHNLHFKLANHIKAMKTMNV